MSEPVPCYRRAESPMAANFKYENKPDDGTCDFCGSLLPDTFMARLEAGDVKLGPSDKDYKVYVHNDGGEPFKQSHRTDKPSQPGEIMKDPMDQSKWTWETRDVNQTKFYFPHLTVEQRKRFVQLLNERKLKFERGSSGFYRLPFFVVREEPPAPTDPDPASPPSVDDVAPNMSDILKGES